MTPTPRGVEYVSAKGGFPILALLGGTPIAKITQEPQGIAIWLPDPDLPDWAYMHKIVPSLQHAQSFLETYSL